jgi:hypothetical protein
MVCQNRVDGLVVPEPWICMLMCSCTAPETSLTSLVRLRSCNRQKTWMKESEESGVTNKETKGNFQTVCCAVAFEPRLHIFRVCQNGYIVQNCIPHVYLLSSSNGNIRVIAPYHSLIALNPSTHPFLRL